MIPRRTERPRTGVAVLGLFTLALTVTYGPLGAVSGLAVTGIWYLSSPLYAFTSAQLVFGALVQTPDVVSILALEAGLLVAIVAPLKQSPQFSRTVVASGLALLGLGSVALVMYQWFGGIRPTTLLLAATMVVFSYGLVRYEFVIRRLAEEANE